MGIQLPIMDGYEVTRQIKADPAMRSIPIMAVTSHALDGEEQTARAAGCDGYVPEPYSPRQLLAKIQQCMPQLVPSISALHNVRFCHEADLAAALGDVHFWGQSGHQSQLAKCPLITQSGHLGLARHLPTATH